MQGKQGEQTWIQFRSGGQIKVRTLDRFCTLLTNQANFCVQLATMDTRGNRFFRETSEFFGAFKARDFLFSVAGPVVAIPTAVTINERALDADDLLKSAQALQSMTRTTVERARREAREGKVSKATLRALKILCKRLDYQKKQSFRYSAQLGRGAERGKFLTELTIMALITVVSTGVASLATGIASKFISRAVAPAFTSAILGVYADNIEKILKTGEIPAGKMSVDFAKSLVVAIIGGKLGNRMSKLVSDKLQAKMSSGMLEVIDFSQKETIQKTIDAAGSALVDASRSKKLTLPEAERIVAETFVSELVKAAAKR